MQDSSAFQYIAIDQIFKSTTNPRLTFDQGKLEELADSIRQNGLIQPITIRPKANGFEIVVGARRFRASQLAELFSVPARIVALDDTAAMEWQLVENSQRIDVHPYEEAQGFQRLLDMPGYDVTALVAKSGKSASHIYARLSLLQLIPDVARAFVDERITASHATLIARLPQNHQSAAFDQCWRKDWSDKEPHLLPSKHLAAWISTHLYLALAEAPFEREDIGLNPVAGACVTCPRRSGYNTSLFADVQGDQCLDGNCYQIKVAAHIDREIAARPDLIEIETTWRPTKEQRPGVLPKNSYRELDMPENPDAEPPCPGTKPALIVFGRNAGKTTTVCLDDHCPVHDPATAARLAKQEAACPTPVTEVGRGEEAEDQAEQRRVESERRRKEDEAEQQHREEERKAEYERQQKQYEAEQKRREEIRQTRITAFERILGNTPTTFTATQLRLLLRLLIQINPYSFLEVVANHFAEEDDDSNQTEQEIMLSTLDSTADEKLTSFALRLVLTDHVDSPNEHEPDMLAEAAAAFAPMTPETVRPRTGRKSTKPTPTAKDAKTTTPRQKRAA